MVLRLDPRCPAAWRDPTTLQLGFSTPRVVLENLSPASERMIAALGPGISRSGLAMVGREAGADEAEITALLERVGPALETSSARAVTTVVVVGTGRTAERSAALLAGAGLAVVTARTADEAESVDAHLGVVVAPFAIAPALAGLWLRRDLPHLAVVLGDSSVEVGPLVSPGRSACLVCLAHHATDADPAWPTLATQLLGRPSPADTDLVAAEAAALVARQVAAWFAGTAVVGERVLIDVATGARRVTTVEPHPGCGCRGVPSAAGR